MAGSCQCGNEPSGSTKHGGISWLAENLLVSHEGLCFMELLSYSHTESNSINTCLFLKFIMSVRGGRFDYSPRASKTPWCVTVSPIPRYISRMAASFELYQLKFCLQIRFVWAFASLLRRLIQVCPSVARRTQNRSRIFARLHSGLREF